MKNAKGWFGSDVVVRSIRSHMTQLDTHRWWWHVMSWVRHEALLQVKMHRGINRMFAFSSGLCSWINKDSRICSHLQLSLPMTSGLWKSTWWSGLVCKYLHSLINRIKKHRTSLSSSVCRHLHSAFYTELDQLGKQPLETCCKMSSTIPRTRVARCLNEYMSPQGSFEGLKTPN